MIRKSYPRRLGIAAALVGILLGGDAGSAVALKGTVVDNKTGIGIEGAIVTIEGETTVADKMGAFELDRMGETVHIRAAGYRRATIPAAKIGAEGELRLDPFAPRALYLSFYGVGNTGLRDAALALVRETELNAVVVDLKSDRGWVAYPTAMPLAEEIGARRMTTIRDLSGFVRSLHGENVYAIARIVVFKDDPLATARPDLAVRRDDGTIFRDRENLAWVDPFHREAWDYNIGLAIEAAAAGFDEIQFDYLRFPDDPHIRLSQASTEASRVQAINGFLIRARDALRPYNVFLGVDVFGYICWNLSDTHIGQRLEDLSSLVDYVSPMLYPSGFQFGIPGYSDPVTHPYDIVRRSLDRAQLRTRLPARHFRPWLQAFKDYAFDRRVFDADEIQAQIKAADDFGSAGWMLWNPRNVYQDSGFAP